MTERFGHESPNVNARRVVAVVAALALFVVVAIGVLHVALHRDVLPHRAEVVDRAGIVPPTPRLQPHPDIDIAAEHAHKLQMLDHYAWVDASHRFARVPIQRAMQLYVREHVNAHAARTNPGPASVAQPASTGTPR